MIAANAREPGAFVVCVRGMAWDGATQAGFALAAVLAGDRELFSVAGALHHDLLPPLEERCRGLSEERARALRELVVEVRPPLAHAEPLPVRGRALVAHLVPRELGRRYVRDAPPARPGFEPEPNLVSWLVRLAQHGSSP